MWTGPPRIEPIARTLIQAVTTPSIPAQSDDGLDPINLIFTGYAPSWWVASNMVGWSDSGYCSGPKTVDGKAYNYTLEHPDPTWYPCVGPRDHIRIWDMGYSPVFGEWSIASAHHEHTVLDPLPHHVIDNWTRAESDARSSFLGEQATVSISNYTLTNAGYYQGVFYDGNATMIQLKPPSGHYPVVFSENGLGNQTLWSVTLNGTAVSSSRPDIVFDEPNGTYQFAVEASGFNVSPSSGTIIVNGSWTSENIQFRTPWMTYIANINAHGRSVTIEFKGNATVATSSVQMSTGRNTTISFMATEIGTIGALNVTVPKSIVPVTASPLVHVDGVSSGNTKIVSDASRYYLYFFMVYGKHSVQLQFAGPEISYVEYFVGGATAVGIVGALFLVFRFKWRRQRSRAPTPSSSASIVP